MSRLQAGMMCVITGCISDSANVGKVVELVYFLAAGDTFEFQGAMYKSRDGGWIVAGENLVRKRIFPSGEIIEDISSHTSVHPRHLTPLHGGDIGSQFVQENQQEPVTDGICQ